MDAGRAEDLVAVGAGVPLGEVANGTTLWRVDRWDADQTHWAMQRTGGFQPDARDFAALNVRPYLMTEHLGNAVLAAGWVRLLNLLIGTATTQAYDATHTRIGVGDGTTAVTTADTTLTGSTSKYFKTVSGAGTIAAGGGPPTETLTFAATFGTSVANFAWQKFGIDQGTADGATETAPLFNAAISNQGVKVSGQTWSVSAVLSFT